MDKNQSTGAMFEGSNKEPISCKLKAIRAFVI